MKAIHGFRSMPLLLSAALIAVIAFPSAAIAAQAPVPLGATSSFAILAGTTITNTGPTTVNGSAGGNIGLFPGTAFPGQADVTLSGAVHLADTEASQAKDALVAAYNNAAGRTPVTRIATELGGRTLTPGVYDSASGTFHITGTLTLDGQGAADPVFVFLTRSTLITASGSNIVLRSGARYCRTFWQVGSSATLGTNSHFVGHIFALTSITANSGASVQGQLLARNGAVTLDRNTITNGICAAEGPVPVIRIHKSADASATTAGHVSVTYTYTVTNGGTLPLSDVTVADDKIDAVTYVSGDANEDHILQSDETWIYTGSMVLTRSTTNIATARGTANGEDVTDSAFVTVRVTTQPTGETTTTVRGGSLPRTASPWWTLLLAGMALMGLGGTGYAAIARERSE
jgi:uncharacterized repeat protein (TIGR01451 family)